MKHVLITILLFLFTVLTKAQKVNPYLLTDQQADSIHAVLAQATNDSIKMELNGIFALYYSYNDIDSSIYFFNQVVAFATRLNLPLWKAGSLDYLSGLYIAKSNYPKAWQAHYTAFEIVSNEAADKNIYPPKFITGIPSWLISRECQLSSTYHVQAILYLVTNDYDKAAASIAEAIRIAEKIGDRESLPQYLNITADICFSGNKPDSALILRQKALALSYGVKWQYFTGNIYTGLAIVYHNNGNDSAALRNVRLAAGFNRQQHYFYGECNSYAFMAEIFRNMHQPDSAIAYCRKSLAFNRRITALAGVAWVYEILSDVFKKKGNTDSAFAYLQLAKYLRDSANNADRVQTDRYKALVVKQQLDQQEAEAERNRQQANMMTYATLGGLLIASLILFLLYRNNRQKQKTNRALTEVRDLQDKKISQLDEAVTKRTEQLNSFRQVMATDFHDQTGNMLSAITRQAMMLKLKLNGSNVEVLPVVESIITNSNELYDSSKDFLWNLNNNSDDPVEVFQYLINYGQVYYNQFNIPFSSCIKGEVQPLQQLDSFAALNLIYIFKEAMTNVVKHAGANEVMIEMEYTNDKVIYSLQDNGKWKPKDEATSHYGLTNMERRCEKNKFGFLLSRQESGTRIEIAVPVSVDFIS